MRLFVDSSPHQVIRHVGLCAYRRHFGMFITPRTSRRPELALELGMPWAFDNSAFTHFDEQDFMRALKRYQAIPGCTFVCAPDVVGNAAATLALFAHWQPIIADMGYPVALVGQDGLEDLDVPWNAFQAFFIGGTTRWKLSTEARQLALMAKALGKWVHMGRVSGNGRTRYAQSFCDSIDGTRYARWLYLNREILPYLQTRQEPLWD